MTIHGPRWTAALALTLVAIAIGAAWSRPRGTGPRPAPTRTPAPATPAASIVETTEEAPAVVETPAAAPNRLEGFRAAKEAPSPAPLSGHVVTSEGPLTNAVVKVEWVAAIRPDREEALRLKRGGARRDREGVWWWKALAVTDDAGFFSLDGLPAVQLRITAAGQVQTAQPGQAILVRAGNP